MIVIRNMKNEIVGLLFLCLSLYSYGQNSHSRKDLSITETLDYLNEALKSSGYSDHGTYNFCQIRVEGTDFIWLTCRSANEGFK